MQRRELASGFLCLALPAKIEARRSFVGTTRQGWVGWRYEGSLVREGWKTQRRSNGLPSAAYGIGTSLRDEWVCVQVEFGLRKGTTRRPARAG